MRLRPFVLPRRRRNEAAARLMSRQISAVQVVFLHAHAHDRKMREGNLNWGCSNRPTCCALLPCQLKELWPAGPYCLG